ncbi:MAG: hypothetical protein ISR59_06440 [Anaerolineales bacterium]|uniref:Uncharacterized protein n=1 Tax=Candidatus Desulfolinea nitratireducens TaxID=2841698 RepID=A0A8J6NEQ7_9CHLR|nr:hypothetical protein [Candidatus Desulfolinea nitratireducens]MBL6960730.1 hypothetical protein [Anaerolineales bacterium]
MKKITSSQMQQIHSALIQALDDLSYKDFAGKDFFFFKYERHVFLGDFVTILMEEYFYNAEIAIYKKLSIDLAQIRYRDKYHSYELKTKYQNKHVVVLGEFLNTFCLESGEVDWGKLIEFNSTKK